MLILSPKILGRGWVQVPTGEPLRSSDQFLDYDPELGGWKICSYWTADGQVNAGRVPYRRAVSWRARLEAFGPYARKVWDRRIKALWS